MVGVQPTIPVAGVSFILGNDLVGGKVKLDLLVVNHPDQYMDTELTGDNASAVFPACVVKRAAARKARMNQDKELDESEERVVNTPLNKQHESQVEMDDPVSVISNSSAWRAEANNMDASKNINHHPFSREQLIHDQEMYAELSHLAESAVSEEVVNNQKCYYKKFGVLMRK